MRDDAGEHSNNVLFPMATEGNNQLGDWDALGMRASGSQSIAFEGCIAPDDGLRIIGRWGGWSIPVLVNRILANAPLVRAFLGLAERAMELALAGQTEDASPGAVNVLGGMEIALATSQSILGRHGKKLDAFIADVADGAVTTYEQGHELIHYYQTAKWVVKRNAIDIVSQTVDLGGSGGYMTRNPCSLASTAMSGQAHSCSLIHPSMPGNTTAKYWLAHIRTGEAD